jgi:hypothetical protein
MNYPPVTMSPIRITEAMLPAMREKAQFPKFAIAEASKDDNAEVWAVHLHEPVIVAKYEIFIDGTCLSFKSFDKEPTEIEPDLLMAIGRYVSTEAEGRSNDLFTLYKLEDSVPEHLVLHEVNSGWTGVIRTKKPRLIMEAHGKDILPIDACEDIAPFLTEAQKFYQDWVK